MSYDNLAANEEKMKNIFLQNVWKKERKKGRKKEKKERRKREREKEREKETK